MSEVYVDPFPDRRGSERVSRECTKCGGRGRLHTQVDGGRCWACGGSGRTSVLVSSVRASERRRVKRATERAAQSHDLDSRWAAAVEAARPWLGARVDVVDKPVGADEYPSTSVEKQLRGEMHMGLLYLRDGKCSVEDVIETVRWMRQGRILGPNFYRMPCVACGRNVPRGRGVALEVAVQRNHRFALCAEHEPAGW